MPSPEACKLAARLVKEEIPALFAQGTMDEVPFVRGTYVLDTDDPTQFEHWMSGIVEGSTVYVRREFAGTETVGGPAFVKRQVGVATGVVVSGNNRGTDLTETPMLGVKRWIRHVCVGRETDAGVDAREFLEKNIPHDGVCSGHGFDLRPAWYVLDTEDPDELLRWVNSTHPQSVITTVQPMDHLCEELMEVTGRRVYPSGEGMSLRGETFGPGTEPPSWTRHSGQGEHVTYQVGPLIEIMRSLPCGQPEEDSVLAERPAEVSEVAQVGPEGAENPRPVARDVSCSGTNSIRM